MSSRTMAAAGTAAARPGPARGGPLLRLGARFLGRDPATPLERFGFHVHEPASRDRVQGILGAFFTGYNAALGSADGAALRRVCEALPEVLHPFAFEGTGMGYGARGLLDRSARPARFAAHVEGVDPGWRFLYYIGLGIWCAGLGTWAVGRAAGGVPEPNLAGLLFDGLGFQTGLFRAARDPGAHRRLAGLPPDARAQAYRGFGRSLWFAFRDDPAALRAAVESLPENVRRHAATGVGLAVAFTGADDLAAACARLEALPWPREAERGLRLALFVRDAGQPQALGRWIAAAGAREAQVAAHLEHARRADAAMRGRPTYLVDFTEAC